MWNRQRATAKTGRPDPTDAALAARAGHGDASAFRALVDRHAAGLFSLAVTLVGSATDAEDVVQETLAGAFRGLGRFEGRSSVKTWLTGILVRQAAMHRRRAGRREARAVPLDAAATAPPTGPKGTRMGRSGTEAAEVRIDVMAAIGSLSAEHREVIVLREFQGLSYDEMAEALDVPRGTVESRLFRARRRLQERLKGYLE